MPSSKRDRLLDSYRQKRSAGATPEPFGQADSDRPGLFVVQKHGARRLHYDLRLEVDGVLRSWAVPQGPSLDPSVKRLAVQTEDHPIEYADFEGIIPSGQYGAGAMIVWDRGQWRPVEDPKPPRDGTEKLLFELRGYKLHGVWTLVKTKEHWLLMKKPDSWARTGAEDTFDEASVLSGSTLEDLQQGRSRSDAVAAELERLGAPSNPVPTDAGELMLAQSADTPFSQPDWLFELKLDGFRLLISKKGSDVRLLYRSGRDATRTYPEIARAVAALPYERLLIDGEVVVLDDHARPVFQRLQKRGQLGRALDIERAAVEHPVTYYAFDLLAFDDYDARPLELHQRKEVLRMLLPAAGALRYCDHVEERGQELFAQVVASGIEGVMAKRKSSRYKPGRSDAWLKVRAVKTGDFAVVGWTDPKGSRSGFGALHLAARRGEQLVYAGRVGSGFKPDRLDDILALVAQDELASPACAEAPAAPDYHWVRPRLVAQIRYQQWTDDGHLRFPVFERFRDDKGIADVESESRTRGDGPASEPEVQANSQPRAGTERKLTLSRLNKVFWPDEGITKGQLIDYYRAIGPWLMPYLRDRPVVLVRYPDGVNGKSFFQKKPPDYVPDWVRTASIWSDDAQEEISHFLVDDVDSLLYLINLGTIPLHVWSSRLETLGRPDWCILDIDPKGAPFAHVVTLARTTHELCQDIGLPSFVKSSGSTGLHVLVPLARACTYEQSRQLAQLIATIVAHRHPDIATVTRMVDQRGGRVYMDYLQNGHGKLLVAPYSVRPLPHAPAGTPLTWDEVDDQLDIRQHTIATVPRRLTELGVDPMVAVLDEVPDLARALQSLSERLSDDNPTNS